MPPSSNGSASPNRSAPRSGHEARARAGAARLGIRGDIIKTMHRAMSAGGREPDVAGFALHGEEPADPVLGRLVERGLDDELKGSAYAIVAGVDGRTHHLKFSDLEMTGDAPAGAIVETRAYDDANGRARMSLATRSDLSIEAQVTARGATWLDRQLLTKSPRSAAAASALKSARRWTDGSIVSSNGIWLGGKVSGPSSLATFSIRSAGASSTRPLPNCRPTRDLPIVHPRRASTSQASIESA